MTDILLRQDKNSVATLSLNDLPANSLSMPMMNEIQAQLKSIEQDDEIRVVVIKSESEKIFCSGHNLKEVKGFTICGVSPIGHLKDIKVYIDNSLSRFETIYAAAGHPHCIFKISFEEIKQITSGSAMDISE